MQKKTLRRLSASLAAGALVVSGLVATAPAQAATRTIGIAYDLGGREIPGFNQLAYIGVKPILDKNPAIKLIESQASNSDTDDTRAERLRLMVKKGANPIIAVGFLYATALGKVAKESPKVSFAIVDDGSVTSPNVTGLLFKEQEGSYLVGVAAALKSKTANVGFIGGVKGELIGRFEAGFIAGAKSVNSKIKIQSTYISNPPDFSGFNAPDKGYEAAKGMYQNGADVIYSAAGGTGAGTHKAAFELGKWSIGVDADEALYASNAKYKTAILTSMLKRVDTACGIFVQAALAGRAKAGTQIFGLAQKGLGYTTTGGYLSAADIKAIDKAALNIRTGKVVVPSDPTKA